MEGTRRRSLALGGVVGPPAFVAAWAVLGARTAHYSPVHDAISRLAADDTKTHATMTAGFVAFGAGVPLYGLALRSALPGRAWMLAVGTGLATLGVAAFPLGVQEGDTAHAISAGLGYVTLAGIPLVAAGAMARQGRQGWARSSAAVGILSGACLLASTLGPLHGLFQRLGLTITDAWIVATAVDMLRRRSS